VRLSPLGTSTTNWPIARAPDNRWWRVWSSRWNKIWQGKPKYSEETCTSATLSTTNPTWPDMESNPGRRGGKPATNRLSYGKALPLILKELPPSTSILLYPNFKSHAIFCLNEALHDVKQRPAIEGAVLSRIPIWSTCPLFTYNEMQNIIFMRVP
jgi:hypothetical protein